MKMSLKTATWFAVLAAERRRADLANMAAANRNAVNATKDGFKQFLEELQDGG